MNSSNTESMNHKEEEELEQLKLSLPKELWLNSHLLYLYQGFWSPTLEATIALQNHFQAQDTDIFVTSIRKAGTTWLKALLFSLCNRANYSPSNTPLLSHNPHELIPHLESHIYSKSRSPDLSNFNSPRLFGTHLPFASLPDSIKDSRCKIIYICRNPLDLFVSSWLFYLNYDGNEGVIKPDMIEHYLDKFCQGKFPFGALEDHVLGYWKQSLARPDKVLFLKYEDLKAEPRPQLKRLAEFVGCSFSEEEEAQGVIDGIIEMCNIGRLKEVEVNKNGTSPLNPKVLNKWLFRKGEVGDWVNHLTPLMAQKLDNFIELEFAASGLSFGEVSKAI